MPPKEKYTDPKLRDEVKEEVHKGDKGGAPGQWSARKAQMMASEYKKRGGDYNTDKSEKDNSQKNLSKWGDEDWQTKEGSGNAKQDDGSEKRYLPKKAWDKMTEKEKEETDEKKLKESKKGKQHVGNTDKAKDARKGAAGKKAEKSDGEKDSAKKGSAQKKKQSKKEAEGDEEEQNEDEEEEEGDAAYVDDGDAEDVEEDEEAENVVEAKDNGEAEEDEEDDDEDEDEADPEEEGESQGEEDGSEEDTEAKPESADAKPGQKRTRATQSNGTNKKQKADTDSKKSGEKKQNGSVGSKHDSPDEPAPAGSADRLPKKGQKAHWKSLPGWVDGKVVEVVYEAKKVEGMQVKAKKDDPRIVLKSNSSGKVCVHKPEAVHFD